MSVRSAQSVTKVFTTRNFSTGAAANADSTPAGTLYVNGTADAAAVTVTNLATGVYKASVTLPTLAVGDIVDLRIAATVNSVSDSGVIWSDTKDVFAGAIPDVAAGGTNGLSTLDAAGVRAAVGLAIANLDTQLALRTGFKLAADGLDLVLVAGKTLPNAVLYIGAAAAGRNTGGGTASEEFYDFAGNLAISGTVDTDGNRSSITYH